MKKQWQIHQTDAQAVRNLARQIGVTPLTARLLLIRGISTQAQAHRFLNPVLRHLTSPLEMADMARAVQRIHRALVAGEHILVYGDYDADGITATALLVTFLRRCGARVDYLIPHRIADGYGLGVDVIIKRAQPRGIDLIVTVDCGSGSGEAVSVARRAGIDTIITDHHPIGKLPADAVAVINPARSDCPSNLAHLAGVGVAFYLIIALRAYLRDVGFWHTRREPNLKRYLDLVAVGTVADVAPLIAENRILTTAGLHQIRAVTRAGFAALSRVCGLHNGTADADSIAFRLAPRLNAAGRLAHARMACELLMTDDQRRADRLAAALGRLNRRRQAMEIDLMQAIMDDLGQSPDKLGAPALVIHGDRWHEGILGILASRLTQRFNRPSIVISTVNGLAKGSARSVDGIDLRVVLHHCRGLLDRFGGHPMAAGLVLPAAQIERFTDCLYQAVAQLQPSTADVPTGSVDAHLPLADVTPSLMGEIDRLGPFGQGNPHPLFVASDVHVYDCQAIGDNHRRLTLGDGGRRRHPAIQFNVTDGPPRTRRFKKIVYRPQWNHWNGNKQLQLVLEDADPEA